WPQRAMIPHSLPREYLDRNLAAESRVTRQKNASHAAVTNQVQHHVTIDAKRVWPSVEYLSRLPVGQQIPIHGLTRQPAIDRVGRSFLRRYRVPTGLQLLRLNQTATPSNLPESCRPRIEHVQARDVICVACRNS